MSIKNAKKMTSLLSLSETISAVCGKSVCSKDAEKSFCFIDVTTDSRNVKEKSLFVPLVGEFQDGHAYILPALEKGASVVFVDQESYDCMDNLLLEMLEEYPSAVFIIVKNTLYALQALAAFYIRKFPSLKKIGITGSSGKTTTKEIIASVLSQKYTVVMNEGNFNSETGLPLSVFKIRKHHQVGVFELGMNRKEEIAELTTILNPDFAVITNIGTAHVGMLGSRDAIAAEKKSIFSLFTDNCVAFIPKNDDYVDYLASDIKGKIVFYDCNLVSNIKAIGLCGTEFVLNNQSMLFPLPGKGNLYDSMAAIAVAKQMDCSLSQIKAGIESVKPLFGRSQIISGDISVIQDCYNANPDSMAQALDFFSSLEIENGRKIAILGDMLELGKDSKKEHEKILYLALKSDATYVICVGKEICDATKTVDVNVDEKSKLACFSDVTDNGFNFISSFLNKYIQKGDVVLLKGSRGIRLERLTPVLCGEDL